MARYVWAKLFTDLLDEPKFRRRSNDERWAWVATILCATDSPERGVLLTAPGVPMSIEELADAAHVAEKAMRGYVERWQTLGMLVVREDGAMSLPHYEPRQRPHSPSDEPEAVRERVSRHRERRRNEDVTERNGDGNGQGNTTETDMKRTPIEAEAEADPERQGYRTANAVLVNGAPAAAPPTPGAAPGAEDAPPPRETEPAAHASPTPSEVLALWNEVAAAADPPLPRADKLTPERAKHLRARQAEGGRDLDWWRGYFGRIAASAFCRGGGREGWKATFTWAIRSEEVVARVAEGAYDDRAGPLARASPQERERMEGIAGTLRAAHDAETGGRSP